MRAAILALMFLCVGAGAAQRRIESETGSLIPVPERARIPDRTDEAQRGRIALAEFARCTVDREATRLRKVLALPAEQAESHSWATLANDECLSGGQMRFKSILLRGAIFVELYRRQSAAATRADRLTAAPFDPATPVPAGDADSALEAGLLMFANCVVQADRVDASAMVAAPTASPTQNAALGALRPFLGPCLPAGQKITLSRPILEGSLAEILYRGTAQALPTEPK